MPIESSVSPRSWRKRATRSNASRGDVLVSKGSHRHETFDATAESTQARDDVRHVYRSTSSAPRHAGRVDLYEHGRRVERRPGRLHRAAGIFGPVPQDRLALDDPRDSLPAVHDRSQAWDFVALHRSQEVPGDCMADGLPFREELVCVSLAQISDPCREPGGHSLGPEALRHGHDPDTRRIATGVGDPTVSERGRSR